MAGRSAGGSRGGGSRGSSGGRSVGGGSRSSSSARSSSGRSTGTRSSSGRSFSSSGTNRNTSRGSSSSGSSRNTGSSLGGGFGFGGSTPRPPRQNTHHGPIFTPPPRQYNNYGPVFAPRPPRRSRSYTGRSRGGSGCFSVLLVMVVIFFFIMIVTSENNTNTSGNVTPNTVKRTALEKGAVTETPYYEDNLNWFHNESKLQTGLKNFYNLTGLQPYILLVDTIGNNPSDEDIDIFANEYYDEYFKDEAHLLFLYIEDIDYYYGITGSRGNAIMDQEAWDILFDHIDKYWTSNLDDDEMFSKAFAEAGTQIMSDPNAADIRKNNTIRLVFSVAAVIIIISIFRSWWKAKQEQKNKEAENLKEILNTPLDTFGSSEIKDLMDKYDSKD